MEELLFLVQNNDDIVLLITVVVFSAAITYVASKARRRLDIGEGEAAAGGGGNIPGRLGIPIIGETFSFLSATNSTNGCYDFVRLRRLWYGSCFKTRIFGKIHVFVPSPEGAKQILTNDFVDFNKGYVKSMADAVGEKSLLCVPHDSHKRIRRLLSDPFSMPSLSKFVQNFDQKLTQKLKKLEESGERFSALQFSMKMILDAMCNMLMSITEDSLLQVIERDCTAVSDAMLSFPLMIPGTRYYKGIKARQRLMETFRGMIGDRRGGKETHNDFLQSMLQRDSYPSSEKLDDTDIMDNLLTLIIAAQTTTAAAMMWSVKFLDENRDAQDRLREEQLSIAKNKLDGASLTIEDLNKMFYGLKVVKETLRMSNVLLWFPRVALNDCIIDGKFLCTLAAKFLKFRFEIKKGWHVNVDATCIHYDPELYKDPMQFNPSRFDEMQKPYSFIPFGSGPRTCLGMNMARVIMLVFLHRLTRGYKWTIHDHDPSLEKKTHVPRLRSGCPITLKALDDGK
ncbi:abscisic acid 8'-hydroxylase 1 isoform X1 [Hevea brasiliensis]|uniref:abscisic acid 8'-hydroxylase 1 isoform X1 n=1 Tax=Hevea brasiliensis TaxID=3981 RepID=UPI0025D72B53|nr:abscisic acid 8'-hydroxylase 1 isoform X1 [Hevea brasiliensis]